MPAQRTTRPPRAPATRLLWLVLFCALAMPGCANCRLPRIDPTGERLFVFGEPPAPPPALPGAIATPGLAPALPPPPPQAGLSVSPSQVIAPVGSEVVMVATVMGSEGFPLLRERVEWMIDSQGPGQIVSPGVRRPLDVLNYLHHLPRKVDNRYAINTTLTSSMTLDRGTPTPLDDIVVGSGQAWITVTSATEGTTHLTAFAPNVEGWDRRQQSALIYWVDVQWRFPPPAITPLGGRSTLATIVSRQSDGSPLAGWIVRYEIAGGPDAVFSPGDAASVDVLTGPSGEAPVDIFQRQPTPGTNQINIQVIRPPVAGGDARQIPVGSGTVLQTWTAGETATPYAPPPQVPSPQVPSLVQPPTTQPPFTPSLPSEPTPRAQPGVAELEIAVRGPLSAVVGSNVQFEIEVANRGTAQATGILISDRFDDGLEHAAADSVIERDLTDLQPGQLTRINVTFHVAKPGELCQQITVAADGGVRAEARSCITAEESPLRPPPEPEPEPEPPIELEPEPEPAIEPQVPVPAAPLLSVTKKGPDQHRVGDLALFLIEVTNISQERIEDLEIADNYEISLEPTRATVGSELLRAGTLGWRVAALEPGQTIRREIELRCLRETPRACNRVTVTAPGIEAVADEACLEIVADEEARPLPPADGAVTVSVAETADPIRLGGDTTYQILLTNEADESAFDVELFVTFGDELRLLRHSGPERGTATPGAVRFPPIRELRAGETVSFELLFRGAREGTANVQVEARVRDQAEPITAENTTEVLP